MDLARLICDLLRPRSLRQRVQLRLTGGLTAVQIFHRLPPQAQKTLLAGPDNDNLATRQALARIQVVLDALVSSGALRRSQAPLQTQEGRGPRAVMVDVYRLKAR